MVVITGQHSIPVDYSNVMNSISVFHLQICPGVEAGGGGAQSGQGYSSNVTA